MINATELLILMVKIVWGNEVDKFNSEEGLFKEPFLITTDNQLKGGEDV